MKFEIKESTKIKLQAGVVRAGRTFIQATAAALGTETVILGADWKNLLSAISAGFVAAIISLIMATSKALPEVSDRVEEAQNTEAIINAAMVSAKEGVKKVLAVEKAINEAAQAKVDEGLEEAKAAVKEDVIANLETEEDTDVSFVNVSKEDENIVVEVKEFTPTVEKEVEPISEVLPETVEDAVEEVLEVGIEEGENLSLFNIK